MEGHTQNLRVKHSSFVPVLLRELQKSPEFEDIKNEKKQLQLIKELKLEFGGELPSVLKLLKAKSAAEILNFFILRWKSKHQENATFVELLQALDAIGLADTVETILQLKYFPDEDHNVSSSSDFRNTWEQQPLEPKVGMPLRWRNKGKEAHPRKLLCFSYSSAAVAIIALAFAFIFVKYSQTDEVSAKDSRSFAATSHPIMYKVSVSSYDEYQAKVRRIPEDFPIEVEMHIGDDKSWPRDVPLLGADKIEKLLITGNLKTSTIVGILTETKNLEELHFIGNGRYNGCQDPQRSNSADYFPYIILQNLNMIRFNNIQNCGILFDSIVNNVYTTALTTFYFENVTITKGNQPAINRLLGFNNDSLTKLVFMNSNFDELFLDSKMPVLGFLKEFEISSPFQLEVNDGLLSKFSTLFPELQHFVAPKSYFQWNDLINLLELYKIETISTGVVVSADVDKIRMSVLRNCHSKLKSVLLAFKFTGKLPNDLCYLEGTLELKKRIRNLGVETNCQVRFLD